MSIFIGDELSYATCEKIRKHTLFRNYDNNCTKILNKEEDFSYKHRLFRESQRDPIVNGLIGSGVDLCEPDKFIRKNKLIRYNFKLRPKCPFFENAGINCSAEIYYTESTVGALRTDSFDLTPNAEGNLAHYESGTVTSETVDPLHHPAYGSLGNAQFSFTVDVTGDPDEVCAPNVVITTATLIRLGLPYDSLFGGITQSYTRDCFDIIGEQSIFNWVGSAFPIGPIGLVMTLTITVRFDSFF